VYRGGGWEVTQDMALKDAIEEAYKEEISRIFAVLCDNLVTEVPDAGGKFARGVGIANEAKNIALSLTTQGAL
jgi:hypothetical protein